MKVLFLSSWYPTDKNPNFGIFVKEHAKAIHSTKNEIVVLALVIHRSNKWCQILQNDFADENGIRTVLIEVNTRFRDILYHLVPLQYLMLRKTFHKKIRANFNPDIIHSNVIFPAGIMGNWLARHLHKPHIITEHWSRIESFLHKPILSGWGINTYKNASVILPVSVFLRNKLIDLLPQIDTQRFHVVPNVIDAEIFSFKEKNRNLNSIHFCSIASWMYKKTPDKNPELFIEALAHLRGKLNKTIILTMIGGGDKVDELKNLCIEKNIQAEFTGYINKHKIKEKLWEADFYIHASSMETFGVVVAEALLCGTPVICSKVGALPELINKTNGILCDNTVDSWIAGIQLAINYSFNYKQISIDTGNRFSLENIGNQIDEVYREPNKIFNV